MRKVIVTMLLLGGCTDVAPCTTCPRVEGVWFLQYVAPDFPCDGGTPTAPPMTMQFTREGSVLRGVIDGIESSGTVYDTFDFTLNGQAPGGGEVVALRALYKPPTTADAGNETLIDGRLTRSTAACRDERRFTGARY